MHSAAVTDGSRPVTPKPRTYADAPRLSAVDTSLVDVNEIVRGAWIELEVGPGRGGFILERAASAPDAGLVGLEVRRKWATIVDARLAKHGLASRARVFAEDAKLALPRLRPDASVRRVFVHFPDPWWKKRHHKRLVMGDLLLDEISRLLEPGGELFVQTDVEERAEEYEALLRVDARFEPAGDVAGSARLLENPYLARSHRERRAIADGLPIHRIRFAKKR